LFSFDLISSPVHEQFWFIAGTIIRMPMKWSFIGSKTKQGIAVLVPRKFQLVP
jgi:hypothetical protein